MGYKVCYMMKRYLTPFTEGYTIGSKNLIKTARQKGVNATVFSAEPWDCQTEEPATYVFRTLFAEKYYVADLITASYASFLSSLHNYDIIHFLPNLAGDIYASFIRSKLRKETNIIGHFSHPYNPYIRSPLSRFRLSFVFNKVFDYVFCTTEFLVSYFRQNTRLPASKVFCVPFPIDTDRYRPLPRKEKLREQYNLSKGYIIAFVGQIEPVRGVFLLLHAFRKLTKIIDNVQLVLSSPGQLYEEPYIVTFNKIVKKLQLEDRVVLLGPQRHLEEIYNLADIVVFPYIKPYYYMDPPLTLLEAMASGAVVVASAVGSANELVINGKNGKLIKPKSVEALAEAIVDVIRNKDDYKSLGVNARETIVSKFSMNTVGSIMRQIYESIL